MNNSLIVSQNNNKYKKHDPKTFENIYIYYAFSTFIMTVFCYVQNIMLSSQVTITITKRSF